MNKDAPSRPKSSLSAFIKLREQEAARIPVQLSPAHQELKPISERDSKLNSSSMSSSDTPDSQSADENNKPGPSLSILNEIPKPHFSLSGMSSPNYSTISPGSPSQPQAIITPPAELNGTAEPMFNALPKKRFPAESAHNTLNTPNFLKEYRYRRKDSKTLIKETGNENKEIHQMAQAFVRRSIRSSTSSQATPRSIPLQPETQDDKLNVSGRRLAGDTTQPANIGSCVVTDESEDEEDMSDERIALRKKLKRSLFVAYFLGILFSMKNRVKIYGALRSIEHVKQFEVHKIEKKKTNFLPLLPTDAFTVVWTILLIILLILTALLTPYLVSFIQNDDTTTLVIDYVFDAWFGADMIISFLSAYHDPVRGLVTNFKDIALNYLKGWFWIDFVAILPFDTIIQALTRNTQASKVNKLLRLLRFPRLYRLFKILRLFKMLKIFNTNQTINRTIKKLNLNIGIMKILKVLVNILFLNHLVSCIWFYVARLQDFDPDTWVVRTGLQDANAWDQYIASYYWAFQTLTTVGFGDIPPKTFLERIVSISWMIVGVGFYSFTIGNLSTILANMDKKSAVLKNKLTAFNNFAIKVKMPEFLRQKVQRFFELNHKENVYYWMDPQEMLKELPANLRTSLLLYSYYGMIKNIRLLQLDANFTASILTYLKLLKLKKSETLYREGDPAEEVYFISKGSVKLVNEYGQSIYALTEGTYFGEVETLAEEKRISFCQATESTILLVCERESFLESLKDFPTIEMQIQRTIQTRKQKYLEKIAQLKEKVEATIKDQDDENRRKLMNSTEYFNKVIVSNFSKEKKVEPAAPKKAKKATAKVHIEPRSHSGYVQQFNPESTVLTSSRDLPPETTTPKNKKKPLEIVNEEKLSATSPKKLDLGDREDEKPRLPHFYRGGFSSPKDEERGLLDETGNQRSLSQNKDFMLSYTSDKEDPLILDADPVSTWRRRRQDLKSPTFNPNAHQRNLIAKRFLASQDEIEEEDDEKEKASKNSMGGLVEEDDKEQKSGSSTDFGPPLGPRGGQENFRGRKFNNFLNINKSPTSQDALGEVKEENAEGLSFSSMKGSRLKLEESLLKENLSKIPTKEIVDEGSVIQLQDLQEEADKSQAKSKGGQKIKLDNLVKLMAQNMLQEDDNSDPGSRVYEIEGEDESKFEDTFDNVL